MFTHNYTEALRWDVNNTNLDGNSYTAVQLNQFVMTNISGVSYKINAGTSSLLAASYRLAQFLANMLKNASLYIGYAANASEMSDYSSHATGIPTDNVGCSSNVTGEGGQKYIEHIMYHTYTNNKANPVTLNKMVVANSITNYWVEESSTSISTALTAQTIPLIIEEITDPIIMQPGETRRFNYKIKFPMFF